MADKRYAIDFTMSDGTVESVEFSVPQADKGEDGADGKDGVSATHSWNGTTLTISSASGTNSSNLKGDKGDKGDSYTLTESDKAEIAGMVDTIPDYVVEEAEATISKVFSHGILGRTIRFIAISDTHEDSAKSYNSQITVSNKHAGQAIKYIADRIGLDFVAHLGDASSCGSWTSNYDFDVLCNDIKNINKFVFSGVRGIKTAFVTGNHDMMSANGVSLLNSRAYTLFGSLCSGSKDRTGGWGYFDLEDAKVRVIYLNTSDSPNSVAYLALTQAQKNWLCETLIDVNTKDDADEWKVILLSHAPLDFREANISTDILLPYVNGESYNSYSFNGKNSAKIISNIHGHVHCFSYGYIADKIRRFTIPNACFVGANHYGSRTEYADWADTVTYNKTANSGKDTSFSLVTIDLDSGKCYVDNYGAGIDRVFSTEYKPIEVIVPTSISNITYSGDSTVGTAINKSQISFSVTYSNGTSATISGVTSVSPETISTVGNNTVTITYTEEGVSVTGTTTIVGTEAPVVTLFNLNRSHVSGTVGESIGNHLDESKAYLNVPNDNTNVFAAKSCTVSGVTENSVTVTESGSGGICVAYPIHLPDIGTQPYRITFDFSGEGKCRTYYKYAKSSGELSAQNTLHWVDTAGTSGSADVVIPASNGYDWLIILFTSNTGKTKAFKNVSLAKAQ